MLGATRWEDRTSWPLSPTQEAVYVIEVGERAWSHAHDCNPYEYNTLEDIRWFIPEVVR